MNVADANARIPLVKAVIRDAMERWHELGRVSAELASLRGKPGSEIEKRARALEEEKARLESDLEGYVAEIAALGAEIKDFELGLVDFPMRVGSRTVYLCWKAGEPRIEYWHEIDAGFAGRRPLADLG